MDAFNQVSIHSSDKHVLKLDQYDFKLNNLQIH